MANNLHWTPEQLRQKGLVEKDGIYVPVKTLIAKGKVEKIQMPPDYVPFKNVHAIKSDGTTERVIPKGKMKAAIKTEVDGIKFDSRLEAYMYTLLRGSGLTFEMQKQYLLQQGFKYNGVSVRPIKIVVDFFVVSKNLLIDTKGFQFRDGTIKYKMLKWYFYQLTDHPPTIEMPKDKKECNVLLNKILYS